MWISILLALLSGALYVFSFAPWDQAYLQWVAFIPLFFALDLLPENRRNLKWLLLIGLLTSMVVCGGGFYWMIHATQQYGGLPFSAALSLFVIFMLTGQLQIPLYVALRRTLHESRIPQKSLVLLTLSSGVLYAGIESLYPKLFQDTAGHAFYHSPWIRQAADLGGPFFLTLCVIVVNEALYLSLRIKSFRPSLIAILVGAFLSIYGQFRITQYQNLQVQHSGQPTLKLALIQANIGDYLKVAAERGTLEATDQVMDRYLGMSANAFSSGFQPDAVVWPETAYPALFQRPLTRLEDRMQNRFDELLQKSQGSFIFGGYDSDETTGQEFNALFIYDPRTKIRQTYHKSILLMFGETLPFADSFPSMKSWFPTMGFFGHGPGPEIYAVKNRSGHEFQMAPSICYEGLFSDFAVEGALKGADALLNVTNDSWFGELGEPYLHLALTQFRSIETRLPLIRSTNTGITVAVTPLGDTPKVTEVSKEEVLYTEIGKRLMPESPYMMMAKGFGGNWFTRLCQLFTLLFISWTFLSRPNKTIKVV
jgi:apolipoprotein N-acyltransferase